MSLRRVRIVVLVVAVALGSSAALTARQTATAPELKAAFLLKFASFTTWPESALPASASFAICVSGDDRVADAADRFAGRQRVHGRQVVVRRVSIDAADGCHLLYWTGPPAEGQALLRQLAGRSVLTVSDSLAFTRAGGVMDVFVDEGKMRFSVNPAASERANLKISSKLLNLARIVKDG